MRIIVNGQQAFGRAVLEALLDRGEDVVGVYTAPDREGRPPDPLKACADEHGIPVFQPKSFRRPEVWEEMHGLEPDLGVMAYVTLFVPEEALNVPKLGTIQYHPSLLPMHKGPSSINWPIIFGESKTGLSIFWPDDGLDTGPILLQKEVEIGPDDTLGSIYFNHLFPMGVEAMLEGVDLVRDGKAPVLAQRERFDKDPGVLRAMVQAWAGMMRKRGYHRFELRQDVGGIYDDVHLDRDRVEEVWRTELPRFDWTDQDSYPPDEVLNAVVTIGTYEGWCRPEDVEIDWHRPSRDVYNLIRGANPQPGAWTRFNGKTLQIFDCSGSNNDEWLFHDNDYFSAEENRDRAGYFPGDISSVDNESFSVWTGKDGLINVRRVRPEGGAKMGAGEFAASVGLKAGHSLG